MAKLQRAKQKLAAQEARMNAELTQLHTNRYTFNPEPRPQQQTVEVQPPYTESVEPPYTASTHS